MFQVIMPLSPTGFPNILAETGEKADYKKQQISHQLEKQRSKQQQTNRQNLRQHTPNSLGYLISAVQTETLKGLISRKFRTQAGINKLIGSKAF